MSAPRSATTPGGTVVFAEQPSTTDAWRACLADDPDRIETDRFLPSAIRRLLEIEGSPERWLWELAHDLQAFATPLGRRFRCPCCDFLTLPRPGGYERCDVCGWEDCPSQLSDVNDMSGPNHVSLREARANFAAHGQSRSVLPQLRRRFPVPAEYPPERRGQIPAFTIHGASPGTSGHRDCGDPDGTPVVAISRTAVLRDGRRLQASRPSQAHPWTVLLDDNPDTAWTGHWLLAAVRGLLAVPDDEWPDWVYALVDELCGFDTPLGRRFLCPCCDHLSFDGAPTGTFGYCWICSWRDDPAQVVNPLEPGRWAASQESLRDARQHFHEIGKAGPRSHGLRRTPQRAELPPVTGPLPERVDWRRIERSATLADGRSLVASQNAPMDLWHVCLDGEERGRRMRRLRWAVERVFPRGEAPPAAELDRLVDELAGFDTPLGRRVRCLCCDFLTVDRLGDSRRCAVCGWEDDLDAFPTRERPGGADSAPLRLARKCFASFGAAGIEEAAHVRRPLPEEFPPGRPDTGQPRVPIARWSRAELERARDGLATSLGWRRPCPCCEFLTLSEPPSAGAGACPVCGWAPLNIGVGGPQELAGARAHYASYGAATADALPAARAPYPAEHPPTHP